MVRFIGANFFPLYSSEPYLYDPLVVSVLNVVKLKSREMDLCLVNTTKFPVRLASEIAVNENVYWVSFLFLFFTTNLFLFRN